MKVTYRPEIDGLRAIAVLAVIFYHLDIVIFDHQPFKGGFIGVDIFFTISGYLISSIIFKELAMSNTFSFKYFYERRVRRIMPTLLLVMIATFPFAWIFFLPSDFIDYSNSILYSLGFTSNFYFWYSGQEYDATSGLFKPFLHTWSLSIEEQFYFLFPFVLFFLYKYCKRYLIYFLIFFFIVSLLLADLRSPNHPSETFYFFHYRMWELLAGAILAYLEFKNKKRSENKFLNSLLPSLGLMIIILNIIFFKLYFPHPSFYTLPTIIGAGLIIWFSNKNELTTRILSSKIFVKIGLISYSLYLWHYPIIAFDRISLFANESILKKFFLCILMIILSILSYYFLEVPARNKKKKFKYIFIYICFATFILILCNSFIIQKKGLKTRLPEILTKNISEEPWKLLKNQNGDICHDNEEGCKFNTSSSKKIFIVGDSHMSSLSFDLKDRVVSKNYQFITSTYSGCLFYPYFNYVDSKSLKLRKNCTNDYFLELKKNLMKEKNAIIIFGGRFPLNITNYLFNNQEGGIERDIIQEYHSKYIALGKYRTIQDSFKNEVLELSKNNKIILIYPIPEVGWNVGKEIYKQWINRKEKFFIKFNLSNITTSYDVYKQRTKSSFELLDSINNKNIFRVYPHKLFCDSILKKRCVTHNEEYIFYADDDHPSLKGTEMINKLIIDEIKKIETKFKLY